jgi:hypothetical protein
MMKALRNFDGGCMEGNSRFSTIEASAASQPASQGSGVRWANQLKSEAESGQLIIQSWQTLIGNQKMRPYLGRDSTSLSKFQQEFRLS